MGNTLIFDGKNTRKKHHGFPVNFGSEAGDLLQQINRCKHERAYVREAGRSRHRYRPWALGESS